MPAGVGSFLSWKVRWGGRSSGISWIDISLNTKGIQLRGDINNAISIRG